MPKSKQSIAQLSPFADMIVSFTLLPYWRSSTGMEGVGESGCFDVRFVIPQLNVNSFRYDLSSSSKLVKRMQSLFLSIIVIGHKIGNQEARD